MNYKLRSGASLEDEVRELGVDLCETAYEALGGARGGQISHEGIFEARKNFKKLRGLLRLVRYADKKFYRLENQRYRDAGRLLSASRDTDAAVTTFHQTLEEAEKVDLDFPGIKAALSEEQAEILVDEDATRQAMELARNACIDGLKAFDDFNLKSGSAGINAITKGFERVHADISAALFDAHESCEPEFFHDMRKAVKYHAMHLKLLGGVLPRLKQRRKAIKHLADTLGIWHDAEVLSLRLSGESALDAPQDELVAFKVLIDKRYKKLSDQVLVQADMLFEYESDRFRKDLAQAFA